MDTILRGAEWPGPMFAVVAGTRTVTRRRLLETTPSKMRRRSVLSSFKCSWHGFGPFSPGFQRLFHGIS